MLVAALYFCVCLHVSVCVPPCVCLYRNTLSGAGNGTLFRSSATGNSDGTSTQEQLVTQFLNGFRNLVGGRHTQNAHTHAHTLLSPCLSHQHHGHCACVPVYTGTWASVSACVCICLYTQVSFTTGPNVTSMSGPLDGSTFRSLMCARVHLLCVHAGIPSCQSKSDKHVRAIGRLSLQISHVCVCVPMYTHTQVSLAVGPNVTSMSGPLDGSAFRSLMAQSGVTLDNRTAALVPQLWNGVCVCVVCVCVCECMWVYAYSGTCVCACEPLAIMRTLCASMRLDCLNGKQLFVNACAGMRVCLCLFAWPHTQASTVVSCCVLCL